MFLNDIQPHDLSAEFVVMGERRRVQEEMAKKLKARVAAISVLFSLLFTFSLPSLNSPLLDFRLRGLLLPKQPANLR